jgi:acyl-CoA reductase-like NAD-dependent aldehyde dehydrogenase
MTTETPVPEQKSPQEQLAEIYREAAERTRQRRAKFAELRKELTGDEWALSMLDDLGGC